MNNSTDIKRSTRKEFTLFFKQSYCSFFFIWCNNTHTRHTYLCVKTNKQQCECERERQQKTKTQLHTYTLPNLTTVVMFESDFNLKYGHIHLCGWQSIHTQLPPPLYHTYTYMHTQTITTTYMHSNFLIFNGPFFLGTVTLEDFMLQMYEFKSTNSTKPLEYI